MQTPDKAYALSIMQRHLDQIQQIIVDRDNQINDTVATLKKLNDAQMRSFKDRDSTADAVALLSGVPVPVATAQRSRA